jgi:hypothetical protein
LIRNTNDRRMQPQRQEKVMRWQGRTYSLDRLYTLRDNGKSKALKDYGPLTILEPTFPDKDIRALNFKATFSPSWQNCTRNDPQIRHGAPNVSAAASPPLPPAPPYPSRGSTGGRRAVVIDLRRPMLISHIGVAGASPRALPFPKGPAPRRQAGRKAVPPPAHGGGARGLRRKTRGRGGGVYVITKVPPPPRAPRGAVLHLLLRVAGGAYASSPTRRSLLSATIPPALAQPTRMDPSPTPRSRRTRACAG